MSVIPDQLVQALGQKVMTPIERTLIYVSPDLPTNSTTNPIIFRLPSGLLDFRRHYIQFDAVMVPGAASTAAFPYPFPSFIDRLVVKCGNSSVADVQNYGFLAGLMRGQHSVDAVTTIDDDGSATAATRLVASASTQTYTFRLDLDILHRVIPTYALGNGSNLEIWMYPAILSNFAEWVGANPPVSYQLSNMKFYLHQIKMTSEVRAVVDAQIATGYQINHLAWASYAASLQNGQRQDILLPWKYKTIRNIIVEFTPTADLTSGTQGPLAVGSRFMNDFPAATLQTALLKIGSMTFPAQNYDLSTPQSYKILKKDLQAVLELWSSQHSRNGETFVGQSTVQSNAVITAFNLMLDSTQNNLLQNGVDNATQAVQVVASFTYSGGGSGAVTAISLCCYESTLQIGPSTVSVLQ
jgi:hypothetical protein